MISSKSDPQELPPLEAVGCRPADVHKQAVDGRANPPVNLVVQLDGCWDCCKDPYILQPHCLGASGPRDCRERSLPTHPIPAQVPADAERSVYRQVSW